MEGVDKVMFWLSGNCEMMKELRKDAGKCYNRGF